MATTSNSADETDKSTDPSLSSLSRRERFERYAGPQRQRNVDVALQRPKDYRARDGYLQLHDIDARSSHTLIRIPQIRALRASSSSSAASTKYRTLAEFRSQDKDRKARISQLYESLRQQSPRNNATESPNTLEQAKSQRQTSEELRKAAVRDAYLKELYERINSDDGDRQGQSSSSGPSLDRLVGFVEQKEEALWQLFCAIDSNDDMLLSQDELLHSLHKAGMSLIRSCLKICSLCTDRHQRLARQA